jgi:hypothetical protein
MAAQLVAVSALAFSAAYLLLRNRAVSNARKQPDALKNTEQVLTTNIRTRMGDAIGTGEALGVTRAQMAHTPRESEVDIHLGGPPLVPTKPPSTLAGTCRPSDTRPIGAPGLPARPLPLADAHARNDRDADTAARGERVRKVRHEDSNRTATIRSAKNKNLPQLQAAAEPWLEAAAPRRGIRTVAQAPRLVDELPEHALDHV